MNEKDIKAIYWLLGRIFNDELLRSYFAHQLNLMGTDLKKLEIQFRDLVIMLDDPMVDELCIKLIPELVITK